MLDNPFKIGQKVRVLQGDRWGTIFKKGNIVTIRRSNVSLNHDYISGRVKGCIYLHTFRTPGGVPLISPLNNHNKYNTKSKILKLC